MHIKNIILIIVWEMYVFIYSIHREVTLPPQMPASDFYVHTFLIKKYSEFIHFSDIFFGQIDLQ